MSRRLESKDEDASLLQLGPDFQKAKCLWNSEVKVIFEHRLEQLKKSDSDSTVASISPSEKMLNDCLAYVSLFGTYNNKQAIAEAKELMTKYKDKDVHEFEIACLNNLGIEEVDEARALVPTLKEKFEDDGELQQLLEDLKRYQSS